MEFANLETLMPASQFGAFIEAAAQAVTVMDAAKVIVDEAAQFASDHPWQTAAMVGGIAIVAAPGLVAAPALGAAGFTSNGVAAGSVAAAVQSSLGSVVAGSTFATLQSAAAGGYGVVIVNGVIQVAGAAGVVAANYIEIEL
jgi:hypothetical protein